MDSGSNHVNSHMGILFMSYGLTDNITLIKFAVLKNETSFLSTALAVKWNSAFYAGSSDKPPIGSGETTLDFKILYDLNVVNDFHLSFIPTYNYLITDYDSITNNFTGIVITGDFPIWNNRFFGEFGADISYKFSSGSAAGNSEWFFKGTLVFSDRCCKVVLIKANRKSRNPFSQISSVPQRHPGPFYHNRRFQSSPKCTSQTYPCAI